MIRQALVFIVAAGVGALLALVVRSTLHRPYDQAAEPTTPTHEQHQPAAPPNAPSHEHHQPTTPVTPPATTPADPHAGHADHTKAGGQPVNTICAICGMDVDPELPTATFQGKVIGFACGKCPPRFAKDPERYGPHYLANRKAP